MVLSWLFCYVNLVKRLTSTGEMRLCGSSVSIQGVIREDN